MPLLYYWRGDNYARDLDFGVAYHLNQANPLLHKVALGDSLWAFTRRRDGAYVLAAELVVSAKTLNPKGYRCGPYRLWGDLRRSQYFQADGQSDITTLIRDLSVRAGGDMLGRTFQAHAAVRRLTEADHQLLTTYTMRMPLESRARLVPEERLEALLLAGDETAVAALMRDEDPGLAADRRRYLMTEAIRRDRQHVEALRDLYDGRCQICEWAPRTRYGADICEGHHVRWLSRGGQDDLSNMVLVCPNHHRVLHRVDAPFDFSISAFLLAQGVERLLVARHSLVA